MSTPPPQDHISDVFESLSWEDLKDIFNIGTTFRLVDLHKRLAQAQQNVHKFETDYGTTLDVLESKGLPEDASYEMQQDYLEWQYWTKVGEKTQNTIDVLMICTGGAGTVSGAAKNARLPPT